MANQVKTTKRERQRHRADQRRLAQRREQQRRVLGSVLGAIALIAAAAVASVALQGDDRTGADAIRPSAAADVIVEGLAREAPLNVGEQVPSFSAPGFGMIASEGGFEVQRDPIDWAEYAGAPAVISIWAEWCPHCQKELPVLDEVVGDYPDVRLVTILSSIGAQPGPEPDEYLADHGLTFPVAIDDADTTLARAFGLQAFPTIYLVDGDGTVSYANAGEVPEDELRAQLDRLAS